MYYIIISMRTGLRGPNTIHVTLHIHFNPLMPSASANSVNSLRHLIRVYTICKFTLFTLTTGISIKHDNKN